MGAQSTHLSLACWGLAGWCHDMSCRLAAAFCPPEVCVASVEQMYSYCMRDGLLRASLTSSTQPEGIHCLGPCVHLTVVGVVELVHGGLWAEQSQALLCRLGWSHPGSGGQGHGTPVCLDCN